ncbi:MAG: hypothetical protein DRG35_00950 [Deltaproteobacteria bacterium]|nr:hypothetical protein [Deltaproteobacteria bacterium]MBW1966773.1 hypothetical protein [Deltaproteobacteria bacterium]RLB18292.1 MAG: hypothetical protein DRG35_00950 [Deltaproteobacteria bacterium]RLB93088.1 MAG: hypothetical protein DRH50_08535 [Deltaproteobacteria bacterium]
MRTYAITIKPESSFGTPLKGDTIFGQFCWQAAEDPEILNGGLDRWIKVYHERPFAVFSSAWPRFEYENKWFYAVRRPELPPFMLGDPEGITSCEERLARRKENKAKRWLLVSDDLNPQLSWDNLVNGKELGRRVAASFSKEERGLNSSLGIHGIVIQAEQQHNTINRLTMTTGKGMFAPYVMNNTWHLPGMELVLFVAIDEEVCTIEQVEKGLERMGEWGFGRDASTGLGRFSLGETDEINWPRPADGTALLSLSPCVPEPGRFQEMFFAPFTRFGRHGAQLLHKGKPFKNPMVMADEGAVFLPKPDDIPETPYIGQAVTGISKAMPEAVAQGYSLVLPFNIPS